LRMMILIIVVCILFNATAYAKENPKIFKYGMKGSEIKTVQSNLIKSNFLKGSADGVFDKKTLEAVKQFQRVVNLPADGVVGPVTMKALKNYKPAKRPKPELAKPGVEVLRQGSRGNDVNEIQNCLIKFGFLAGRADGIYGQATVSAVRNFQQEAKLVADGMVGATTIEAIKRYKPPKGVKRTNVPNKNKPQISHLASPKISYPQGAVEHQANWRPITLESTAYTRYDEGCTDYTYNGTYLRRGLAAVDPNIIPLGTRLYIPDYGYAIADDIGGAIQGHRIDLAMDTLEEAFDYGRRHVTAYIIES